MPPLSIPFTPRPYVADRFESRDRTSDAIRQSARDEADAMRRSGQRSAQMWSGIGSNISGTLQDIAAYPEQQRAAAMLAEKQRREQAAYEEQQQQKQQAKQLEQTLAQLQQEYQGERIPTNVLMQRLPPSIAAAVAGDQDKLFGSQADAERRGRDVVADMGGYGPLEESSVDDVMRSPAAGRTRYSFGPGTTNGPEVQPNAAQQAKIAADAATAQERADFKTWLQSQGGTMTPGGGAAYPPEIEAPKGPEDRLSGEDYLAYLAAQGDEGAKRALAVKRAQRPPQSEPNDALVPMIGPDGKTRYGTRQEARGQIVPSGSEKPSSGVQKRVLNFFNRAEQADKDLEGLEEQVRQTGLMGQARMAMAPNVLQSQMGQSYTQAQRAFTEARLRKDSGAAIPESEFENDRVTYFAQPGDSAETLDQKRRARAAVLASLAFESGQALAEFMGSADEANRVMTQYKTRAQKPVKPGGLSPDNPFAPKPKP